jgi:hypothetical protein
MTKFLFIISLSLSISIPLHADETSSSEDSNLTDFNYPSHNCGKKIKKPKKVARFKSFEDVNHYNSAIVEYNINVASYNKKIKIYKSCINQYIESGNNDIDVIKKRLNKALKEARSK